MLKVWAADQFSGQLDRIRHTPDAFVYAYDLAATREQAVSLTMPIDLMGYEHPHELHPIFQMNLPEGRLRSVLERRFRKVVPGFDDLSLLEITGPSQIGRLRYGNETTLPAAATQQSVQEILAYEGTEDLFADLLERYATTSGVSGVQPKVLVRDAMAWSLSGDGRQSLTVRGATHLVKTWESDEFPELAANEYFCMRFAGQAGLPVPPCELSVDGRFLVVERFDLARDGSYLGFEDACVLQGFPVQKKYDGSYEKLAKTLRLFTDPMHRANALEQLFRTIVVSCAVRNGDAHLKNFGVIYTAPGAPVRAAPAYDIVSTAVYLPHDVMALTLDGRKSYPGSKVLTRFAQQHCGIEPEHARRILEQAADALANIEAELHRHSKDRPAFAETARKMVAVFNQGVRRSLMTVS